MSAIKVNEIVRSIRDEIMLAARDFLEFPTIPADNLDVHKSLFFAKTSKNVAQLLAGPVVKNALQPLARTTMLTSDDSKVVRRAKCIGVDARRLGVDIDIARYVWRRETVKGFECGPSLHLARLEHTAGPGVWSRRAKWSELNDRDH